MFAEETVIQSCRMALSMK